MGIENSRPRPTRRFSRRRFAAGAGALFALAAASRAEIIAAPESGRSVRDFGAKGDGVTLDTGAINKAIAAAADAGGGTVYFPPGKYLSFTIHLRSHVALHFSAGAVVIAATPQFSAGHEYDAAEPQPETISPYQDFGHNHWHNSLIWGENLEGASLTGQGELWGRGLEIGYGDAQKRPGAGDKVIALKRCQNVVLRDFSIRAAGHFGVLATAVDNLSIENLRVDTIRDGIDIDCCHNVHIHACNVNAPWDDAIVLKSSYALGELRTTEHVTISDCVVSGSYEMGSLLDGADLPISTWPPNYKPARVGRIKIGTETSGDIRNIVVSNCVLDGCHGLAVISEDGATVEDVLFSNITMRNMIGPPIFVRLGGRRREPQPVKTSAIRRIGFYQIDCVSTTFDDCSIIAGIPGARVQDVTVAELRVQYPGGGRLRTGEIGEHISSYPEPNMFGPTPAQGFYLRHAEGLELRNIVIDPQSPDPRPLVWMDDVRDSRFENVRSTAAATSLITGTHTERITIVAPPAEGK